MTRCGMKHQRWVGGGVIRRCGMKHQRCVVTYVGYTWRVVAKMEDCTTSCDAVYNDGS